MDFDILTGNDQDDEEDSQQAKEDRIRRTVNEMFFNEERIQSSDFVPPEQPEKDQTIFYSTKQVAVYFRLFFTLYERVLKAHEISSVLPVNEVSAKLSEAQ